MTFIRRYSISCIILASGAAGTLGVLLGRCIP